MTNLQKATKRIDAYNGYSLSLANLGLTSEELAQLIPRIKELGNLKKLDVSNNNLEYLPDAIGDFTELTELNASNNRIRRLPDTIGNLRALKKLNLANNSLKRLPMSIRKITRTEWAGSIGLIRLDLTNNYLDRVTGLIRGDMRFGGLILDGNRKLSSIFNRIEGLPTALDLLTKQNLIKRRIKAHRMGGVHVLELEEKIASAKNNNILDLSDSNLTNEKLAELLARITEELPNLKTLILSNNNLTELPETIGILTNLEELRLDNNGFTSLSDSIADLSNLRELDLSYNDFTYLPNSMQKLGQLSKLNLKCNFRRALPNCIENLSNLKELHVEESLPLKDLVYLMDMPLSEKQAKYYQDRKLGDSFGEYVPKIHVYGLNRKLTDEHGEFMPRLHENFMAIAKMVVDNYPNTNISFEEFHTFYNDLDPKHKQDILGAFIPLSELNFDFEKYNIEEANENLGIPLDTETLTSPLLQQISGTIPSSLENKARLRRGKGRKWSLYSDGAKEKEIESAHLSKKIV